MKRSARFLGTTVLLALLGGCVGNLGDAPGGSNPSPSPALTPVAAPTLRRLTTSEFTHSVHDLLGDVTLSGLEPDAIEEGFFAVGASAVAISPSGVAKYEKAIGAATEQAFADPARVATILVCVPMNLDDDACSRAAIAAFGRRAWRRPLLEQEIERYYAVAASIGKEMGDSVAGLRHAIWGILQSPHFLYRNELGAPSLDNGGRLKFSPFEMASRLSYTLWNTLPDEDLLDAAEKGELSTTAGIQAQAKRMLADPRRSQGVANFMGELYGLWRLGDTFKDQTLYPDWTATLPEAMREDFLRRVDEVVFNAPTSFLSLYDGRQAFVNNELAKLYGLPEAPVDGFRSVELPADGMRRGLIGSGAVLAMYSLPGRTSATERGKFISEALLCITVPPPPPKVDTKLTVPPGSGPLTLREKLAPHRADPTCASCHNITDPIGLALENFDTLGRFRETDQGLTIDASGVIDGSDFKDGSGLAVVLREHPEAASCLVRKLFTYVSGRAPGSPDSATLDTLEADFSGAEGRFDQLLLALVTSEDFQFAQPPATTIRPD